MEGSVNEGREKRQLIGSREQRDLNLMQAMFFGLLHFQNDGDGPFRRSHLKCQVHALALLYDMGEVKSESFIHGPVQKLCDYSTPKIVENVTTSHFLESDGPKRLPYSVSGLEDEAHFLHWIL